MFRFPFFIGALLLWSVADSQTYSFAKQWDKRFGGTKTDYCFWLTTEKDGSFLMGGTSESGMTGDKTEANWDTSALYYDYWLVKVNAQGNKQWDKRLGAVGPDNFFMTLALDRGKYLVAGSSGGGINGDKSQNGHGSWDFWLVLIDSNGNKIWDKRYGGNGDDYLLAMIPTDDNGYVLGGRSNSDISGDKTQDCHDPSNFYYDYWVIKIDSSGNKQWDKRYGGELDDFLSSIIQTTDGGYIIAGYSRSENDGEISEPSKGSFDFWIVKTDSIGNKQWDKRYGGEGGERLCNVLKHPSGGYVLAGGSSSGVGGDKTEGSFAGSFDYWIFKIDEQGNKIWDKDYGGTDEELFQHLEPTSDGGFLISGTSLSNASGNKTENNLSHRQAWVVKTDSIGYKQWDKTILVNGDGRWAHALQTADGCYAVGTFTTGGVGGYKSQPNWDNSNVTDDYWLIKFCMHYFNDLAPRVGDQEQREIRVWPNPFSSDVSIALTGSHTSNATFTITNTTGQIVYQQQENNLAIGYTKMLDLSYLPNGIYFVEVSTTAGKATQRVVKQ